MRPVINQPVRLNGTAKIHKFEHPQDATKENINF